jgi:hypothetical protein
VIDCFEKEELKKLLADAKELMISDAKIIRDEFGGGASWEVYCCDTKAIIDRIDSFVSKFLI